MPRGLQDLFPTMDWTQASISESAEFQSLDRQEIPWF